MLRKALTMAMMFAVTSAHAQTEPATRCTEPRPQTCLQIYAPVCGVMADGGSRTFGNACTACAERGVRAHSPGACQPPETKR